MVTFTNILDMIILIYRFLTLSPMQVVLTDLHLLTFYLFYLSFTPFLTLFQLYHVDSSLIHDPWVNKLVLG